MKWFWTLLLTTPLFGDAPFNLDLPVTDLEKGLPTTVAGCVNVISGDYVENETDIHIKGPCPLNFERLYSSADYETRVLFCGWRHAHDSGICMQDDLAHYTEPSGRSSYFKGKKHLFNERVTNCCSGLISARTNPNNTKLTKDDYNNYTINRPDGSTHKHQYYKREFLEDLPSYDPDWKTTIYNAILDPRTELRNFHLVEKIHPNGSKTYYTYDDKHYLKQVQTTNPDGKITYGTLTFTKDKEGKDTKRYHVLASDGTQATYHLEKLIHRNKDERRFRKKKYYFITKVERTCAPTVNYEYRRMAGGQNKYITKRRMPDGRFRGIRYNYQDYRDMNLDRLDKEERHNLHKVCQITAPHNGQECWTHRFFYHKHKGKGPAGKYKGWTTVTDANGGETRY